MGFTRNSPCNIPKRIGKRARERKRELFYIRDGFPLCGSGFLARTKFGKVRLRGVKGAGVSCYRTPSLSLSLDLDLSWFVGDAREDAAILDKFCRAK